MWYIIFAVIQGREIPPHQEVGPTKLSRSAGCRMERLGGLWPRAITFSLSPGGRKPPGEFSFGGRLGGLVPRTSKFGEFVADEWPVAVGGVCFG